MITAAGIAALRKVLADHPNNFPAVAREALEEMLRIAETTVIIIPEGITIDWHRLVSEHAPNPDGIVPTHELGVRVRDGLSGRTLDVPGETP